jgi:hypothetical protein
LALTGASSAEREKVHRLLRHHAADGNGTAGAARPLR